MNKNYPGKVPTEQLGAEYQAGATLRDLADEYGISFQAVHDRLTRAGYDLTHVRRSKKPPRQCPTCKHMFIPKTDKQIHCQMACARTENKEYCPKGHRLTPKNLTKWSGGHPPRCRLCHNERVRACAQRRRNKAL